MATISLTISTTAANRFAAAIGYSATLPDGSPNPVTALAAGKSYIADQIKAAVRNFENPQSAAAAILTNNADIDSVIIIT